MQNLTAQFLTNAAGETIGVFLDLDTWRALQADLEELGDARAFDQALPDPGGAPVPLEQAVAEVERSRQIHPPEA